MDELIVPITAISFTNAYISTLRNIYGNEMPDKDILNQTIVPVPTIFGNVDVCGWNLSHIATYYYASKVVDKHITNNKILGAGICFIGGCIWYVYEDSTHDQSYTSNNHRITYPNITKPQPSDFIFNIAGQVLFIAESW